MYTDIYAADPNNNIGYMGECLASPLGNAGINLTGYHPPPGTRGFCTEMCAQPQGFCKTENSRGAGLKMTMSLGPGICINFLSNMKIVNTVIWA